MTTVTLTDFGGFVATAAGSALGVVLNVALSGNISILAASALGGAAGSAIGWIAFRSAKGTNCHTA